MKKISFIIALTLGVWVESTADILDFGSLSLGLTIDKNLTSHCEKYTHNHFKKGVCLFHQDKQSLTHYTTVIETLNRVDKNYLALNKESFIELMLMLTYANRASLFLERTNNTKELYSKDNFCINRDLGLRHFYQIEWSDLMVGYSKPLQKKFTLTALITQMEHHFTKNHPFNSEYDNLCKEALLDKTTVIKDAKTSANKLLDENLKSINPFSALFSSKVTLLEKVVQTTFKDIVQLEKDSESLNETLQKYKNNFDKEKNKSDIIITAYKKTLIEGYKIKDNIERWQENFLKTGETDLLEVVKNLNKTLTGYQEKLTTKKSNIQTMLQEIEKPDARAKQHKKAVKYLCKKFYCQWMNEFNQSDTSESYQKDIKNQENPLFIRDTSRDILLSIGNENKSLTTLCGEAGLKEEYMKISLSDEKSSQCMKEK